MILINKKIVALFFCCYCTVTLMAQSFKYKALLDTVAQTGFYQIRVSPELSSHVKTDFSDVRIADEKGKWVPHLIKNVLPDLVQSAFKEFPVLSNEITDSGITKLIIENKGTGLVINNVPVKNITQLVLFIKNASVSRYASVSGSNDLQHWYIIGENILLSKNYETAESYFINSISFNTSDYKYFKLLINNEKADPLNIIKAGSYTNFTYYAENNLTGNPGALLIQKDSSDGKSYITVKNSAAFHIDRLNIDASGPKFFERMAELHVPLSDSQENKTGYQTVATLKISSAGSNSFDIKKMNTRIFYIIIDNKDNPPLKINSVGTSQQLNNIITYLEQGKQYQVLAGNDDAAAPDYDLQFFKDSIPASIAMLGTGPFIKMAEPATDVQKNDNNKWWLWPSIIAAIIMLGFLSWKLLGDMKKNDP